MAGERHDNGQPDPAFSERLQRVLAARGVASRRKAEEMIQNGRVRVDGRVVTKLGTRVNPHTQRIEVDGKQIAEPRYRYILLNKPSGYITTMSDERGRRTVMELVQVPERVVPVGRLDRPTEGLLLLTNDGELAHRVMHPSYEVEKEYEVLVDGDPPPEVIERLRRGVTVDGEKTVPTLVRPLRMTEDGTLLRFVIQEGRNRIVRRMFEAVNYPVLKLRRTRIGPLQLGSIRRGAWRDLTQGELAQIREAVGMADEDVIETPSPRQPERNASERRTADRTRVRKPGPPERNRGERRGPRGQQSRPPHRRHKSERN